MRDEVVFPHEAEGGLVRVVQALTSDLAMQGGDAFDGIAASLRAALAPGECLLCGFEFRGGLRPVAGVGHELTVGVGQEVGYAHVDADHAAGLWKRFGLSLLGGEDDVPASPFTLDRDRLDLADHGPVPVHLDVSGALEANTSDRVVRGGVPAASVAVLREVHGVEPRTRAETRISRLVPSLHPPEERGERLVQAVQGSLLGAVRAITLW
ncbi:hypothetical protein BN2537_141 [Streptomyces venezuelae]|nr:hypothetical protein BN2537_141 [Streptomyces venezuelae]